MQTTKRISFQFKKLDHVQICMPPGGESEARQFYFGTLRLQEIKKPAALIVNGGLWFRIADIELHIGVESQTNRSKRHPAFEVDDLAAAREFLLDNGIPIKDETSIPGCSRFSFMDPFDNRIELLQRHI